MKTTNVLEDQLVMEIDIILLVMIQATPVQGSKFHNQWSQLR